MLFFTSEPGKSLKAIIFKRKDNPGKTWKNPKKPDLAANKPLQTRPRTRTGHGLRYPCLQRL